jgi:hypothetical protein
LTTLFRHFCDPPDRSSIPSVDRAQLGLEKYGRCGIAKFDVTSGRQVIMPGQIRLFCSLRFETLHFHYGLVV